MILNPCTDDKVDISRTLRYVVGSTAEVQRMIVCISSGPFLQRNHSSAQMTKRPAGKFQYGYYERQQKDLRFWCLQSVGTHIGMEI